MSSRIEETQQPVAARRRRRLTVNITPLERIGRVLIGVAAVVAAVVLLFGAGSVLAVVLEVLLAAAGLDLAATGALGHCPLYQKLGFEPTSLRKLA
jgi:hypothetical protein